MNLGALIIIGAVVWVVHHFSGQWSIPRWVWKALLVFFIVMVIRNATAAWDLLFHQADAWWPIVQENINKFFDGLRNFVKHISSNKGGL